VKLTCLRGRYGLASGSTAQIPQSGRISRPLVIWENVMKQRVIPRFSLFSLVLLIVLPCVAASHAPDPAGPSQNQNAPQPSQLGPYAIRSNVDLVVLRATVRDGNGAPVSGLAQENFQVYEDKVLQPIESFSHDDIPVTIGLVIDSSGSMGPKRAEVVDAALAFVRSSNAEDQMFVVNFNEHVSMGLSANMPFTNNAAQLETALTRNATSGMTALYDAIAVALEQLQKGKWDKKVLIVVSDGGDNASKHNLAQVISMVNQANAVIYTLGVYDDSDGDRNPRVLMHLSRASGGEAFFPQSFKEILPICEKIARDIRSQYTITFEPTNKKEDGTYRAIEVKARASSGGKRLTVITRAGYSAPLNLPVSEIGQDNRP
jgi:Ca-activated chloride channel homolog